jgi:hypothetical protein
MCFPLPTAPSLLYSPLPRHAHTLINVLFHFPPLATTTGSGGSGGKAEEEKEEEDEGEAWGGRVGFKDAAMLSNNASSSAFCAESGTPPPGASSGKRRKTRLIYIVCTCMSCMCYVEVRVCVNGVGLVRFLMYEAGGRGVGTHIPEPKPKPKLKRQHAPGCNAVRRRLPPHHGRALATTAAAAIGCIPSGDGVRVQEEEGVVVPAVAAMAARGVVAGGGELEERRVRKGVRLLCVS